MEERFNTIGRLLINLPETDRKIALDFYNKRKLVELRELVNSATKKCRKNTDKGSLEKHNYSELLKLQSELDIYVSDIDDSEPYIDEEDDADIYETDLDI